MYIKGTTYIGDLKLSPTLTKALIKCMGNSAHTYENALKVSDKDLRACFQVGRATIRRWNAFKAAHTTEQVNAVRISAEQKEIARLMELVAKLERELINTRFGLKRYMERFDRLTSRLTVAQLRDAGYSVDVDEDDD